MRIQIMKNSLTITLDEQGRTVTYSKEIPESPTVNAVIETYLEAYDAFGFQNDLDVIIRNGLFGDTKISFDTESYITEHDNYKDDNNDNDLLCQVIMENIPEDYVPSNRDGNLTETEKALDIIFFLLEHYHDTKEIDDEYDEDDEDADDAEDKHELSLSEILAEFEKEKEKRLRQAKRRFFDPILNS